ncbi:BQ5605_C007g04561 [Microbotryum silenes-dioicae]|uniref:BQ5605_C007g04561 protein n=1 Tax=Microbotryum silenes-dioicae TaxID=796604 RepID=A0A2X0N1I1_9BASI|nr:BQ5605_C007g04561 [Microbotryum silenes-dioicae]
MCGCGEDGTAGNETWAGGEASNDKAGTPGAALGTGAVGPVIVGGCRTLGPLWPDKCTRRGHERNVKRRDNFAKNSSGDLTRRGRSSQACYEYGTRRHAKKRALDPSNRQRTF